MLKAEKLRRNSARSFDVDASTTAFPKGPGDFTPRRSRLRLEGLDRDTLDEAAEVREGALRAVEIALDERLLDLQIPREQVVDAPAKIRRHGQTAASDDAIVSVSVALSRVPAAASAREPC